MQRVFNSIFFSTLPLATIGCLIPLTTQAQVTPDGTTSTTVNQNGNNYTIEQGDRVGDNLFHSFNEFSVPTLGSAAFNNAGDIANIFSRVTGSNISNIDGLISANSAANLYLINPNGIIFGQNASLNLGGSFFASTADSLLFEGDAEFSAVNPQASPLLEVSIPIGLNFRDNPGEIVNRSFVQNDAGDFVGLEVASGENLTLIGGDINFEAGEATAKGGNIELGGLSIAGTVGLHENGSLSFPEDVAKADLSFSNFADVDVRGTGGGSILINARNLNLEAGEFGSSLLRAGITSDSTSAEAQAGNIIIDVAENITLNDSHITNQVDSGGVGNSGNINIFTTSLEATNSSIRSDVGRNIGSNAIGNAGVIEITTGNLLLSDRTFVATNIFGQGDAGNITIDATDNVNINDGSSIISDVAERARGNAGVIEITTGNLTLTNRGRVSTITDGQGDAGTIRINASETISADGEGLGGIITSNIGSDVTFRAEGDAGTVTINTASLSLTNGGTVATNTFGQGDAGTITINALETISVDGEDLGDSNSFISSNVNSNAEGNAGDVTINTASLSLTNGGTVSSSTFGRGDAGTIIINASETISVDGEDPSDDNSVGGIFSNVGSNAIGNAGEIEIITGNLTLTNGGGVATNTFGQGDAGNITINASETISVDGKDLEGVNTAIASDVTRTGIGNAGVIEITTGNLTLTDGGRVGTITDGQGNAGTIRINASETISVDGGNLGELFTSNIGSDVTFRAVGNAGTVTINTASLSLTNGGKVGTSTSGRGDAGIVNITATDTVNFDGEDSNGSASGATSEVGSSDALGDAGGVTITTGNLNLTNGGQVSANTFGQGNAGLVEITASDTITIDGETLDGSHNSSATSLVGSSDAVGDAGGVTITTSNLNLTNGGRVDASTFGQGNAGLVEINASDTITLDGEDSGGFSSSATSRVNLGAVGDARGVTITTNSLSLTNGGEVSASTFGQGNAGLVEITASDTITIDGEVSNGFPSNVISAVGSSDAVGDAGGVTITTDNLNLTNGGRVDTNTFGQGNAGSVEITASDTITIDGKNSRGFGSNVGSGVGSSDVEVDAGGVTITTGNLNLTNGGEVNATTFGRGNAGSITVEANSINLNNQASINAVTQSETGDSANINLQVAEDIIFKNNSFISARALEDANGGNVTINANDGLILAFPNQNNDIIANAARGVGGNINIFTQAIFGLEERRSTPPNQTNDIDASSEFGLQGDFSLNTPDFDPTTGLINLPASVGDASDQISQNPCQQGVGSEFIVTGKGGLPPTVSESLNSEAAQVSLIETVPSQQQKVEANAIPTENSTPEAVPAQGWVFNEKGEVTLTAYSTSNNEIQRSGQKHHTTCSGRNAP